MILREGVLFPMATLRLRIFEPRYKKMLEEALESHRMFCVAMQKPGYKREAPLPVAGLGLVRVAVRADDGTYNLVIQGIARVRLRSARRYKPYRVHPITPILCEMEDSPAIDAMRFRLLEVVERKFREKPPETNELLRGFMKGFSEELPAEACMAALRAIPHPGQLADIVTLLLVNDPLFRQLILQSEDLRQRYRNLFFVLEGHEMADDTLLDDGEGTDEP